MYSVNGNKVTVCVGSVEHPMVTEHYIEWIAIESKCGVQRKLLKPGDAPKADFPLTDDDSVIAVYAYCNLHGLWKTEWFSLIAIWCIDKSLVASCRWTTRDFITQLLKK